MMIVILESPPHATLFPAIDLRGGHDAYTPSNPAAVIAFN